MPRSIGGLFGFNDSSGGGGFAPITKISGNTPAFSFVSASNSPGALGVDIQPLGTAPQLAFGERFPRFLSDVDALRGLVAPGVSKLREASLAAVRNRAQQRMGTLRQNLANRRVLGSSFAEDALTRADREFAEAEANVEAQSIFAELEGTSNLLKLEFGEIGTALNREMEELGLALGFGTRAAEMVSNNLQAANQLAAAEAEARGSGFGSLLGTVAGMFAPIKF